MELFRTYGGITYLDLDQKKCIKEDESSSQVKVNTATTTALMATSDEASSSIFDSGEANEDYTHCVSHKIKIAHQTVPYML